MGGGAVGLVSHLKEGLVDLLFPGPSTCPICGQDLYKGRDVPCPPCRRRVQRVVAPFCPRCGKPLTLGEYCPHCGGRGLPFLQARAAGLYQGVLRRAIHLFKFKGAMDLLPYLEQLLLDCLEKYPLPGVDVLIPVPLHAGRERERGFNQAALLAAGLGRHLQLPVDYRSLIRRWNTPPTSGLSRQERVETLWDAFSCRGRRLRGRHVLLIDDILTTGSTAAGCSTALLKGGAAGVYVLTVATVPAPAPWP